MNSLLQNMFPNGLPGVEGAEKTFRFWGGPQNRRSVPRPPILIPPNRIRRPAHAFRHPHRHAPLETIFDIMQRVNFLTQSTRTPRIYLVCKSPKFTTNEEVFYG